MPQNRAHAAPRFETPSIIEFIPGRIDSPNDFPRHSVHIDSTVAERSSYLKSKIRSSKPETPFTSRIELRSADPAAFNIYVAWLESGRLDFLPYESSSAHRLRPGSLSWRQCKGLIKAHILGSKFGDSSFQNRVMNELLRWLQLEPGYDSQICDLVFGKQASGVSQQLKCLIIDKMFTEEEVGDELLSMFMKRKIDGRIGDLQPPECEYHVHDQVRSEQITEATRSKSPQVATGKSTSPKADSVNERRSRNTQISAADPWIFSSRSRISRKFESIDVEGHPLDEDVLPPPPCIHPSLLNSVAVTPPIKSRPPPRKQNLLFLPHAPPQTPKKYKSSFLKDLPANENFLEDATESERPSTAAATSSRKPQWPIRPPTPFRIISRRPNTREIRLQNRRSDIHDESENWPLGSIRPSSTPAVRHRWPATPIPLISFPPALYDKIISPVSTELPGRITPSSSGSFRRRTLRSLRLLPSLPSISRTRTRTKSTPYNRTAPERPLPPLPKDYNQRDLPFGSTSTTARGTSSHALRRKPAPDSGLEFLARYPEGDRLIYRATVSQGNDVDEEFGVSAGRATVPSRPVELQGRTVALNELLVEEVKSGIA